ncbi:MAG TPA: hypothetical protein VK922_02480 [Gemmatimonadaceae bacterium]|nr:hypothetical protein [Gemmatimonadaceae bacterium]
MAQFTHEQYDALERAVADGRRVAIFRRGTEYVVIPHRLTQRGGREIIETRNPTTGDRQLFFLDEVDGFDVV